MSALETCAKSISKARSLRNLNIFITETFESATEQAKMSQKRIQEGRPKSKIDGSLGTVKDNFCTRSIKTTAGSRMLENYVPPYNATVVERLSQAGSIMLGKTNLDEFGMGTVSNSYYGTVKNPYNVVKNKPWDKEGNDFYISGGSSGGSAASVSSGIADFSIGSDTGGSVRNPASMCGCIGYKPTYGLISRHGLIPLNNYFDTVGIMSMTIECIANVLNVVAGPDLNDSTSIKSKFEPIRLGKDFSPSKLRIGIPKEFFPSGLSESNLEAWKRAVQVFTKHSGAEIVSISLPNSIYSMSCYSVLTSCEIASNFSRYDGLRFGYHANLDLSQLKPDEYNFEKIVTKNRDESLGPTVKSRLVSGNYFLLKDNYEKYFLKSHQIKQLISQDFERTFANDSIDLILTPTCFHDTPTYEEYLKQEEPFDEKDFFTACANIAGVPAISIPCHESSKTSLPVGIQLISNWKTDNLLLNTADWFIRNNNNFRL